MIMQARWQLMILLHLFSNSQQSSYDPGCVQEEAHGHKYTRHVSARMDFLIPKIKCALLKYVQCLQNC
jgi:hypothetical protein